jgi:hypothetical protein
MPNIPSRILHRIRQVLTTYPAAPRKVTPGKALHEHDRPVVTPPWFVAALACA